MLHAACTGSLVYFRTLERKIQDGANFISELNLLIHLFLPLPRAIGTVQYSNIINLMHNSTLLERREEDDATI